MAQKSDVDLLTQKEEIKAETDANENTATRVGQMFEDIIDSKANNNGAVLTGAPSAPTASAGTNDTQIATTAFVQTALGVATLNLATASTAGGTITLDMNSQSQRMFVGSASFGTAKAIALSNTTNAVVFQMTLTLTNVAAVLTFPSTFVMLNSESLSRWNNGAKTFTPTATGKHEFSAAWDGTNWNMLVTTPFV